tara:strand:+ start:334 stop:504 length:171 start_codon:yes stop_codon:yes gene_type:complete
MTEEYTLAHYVIGAGVAIGILSLWSYYGSKAEDYIENLKNEDNDSSETDFKRRLST